MKKRLFSTFLLLTSLTAFAYDGKDGEGAQTVATGEAQEFYLAGQNGADGGRGGNGGDLVVVYKDLALLKNIFLHSLGGKGSVNGEYGRLFIVHEQFAPYRPDNKDSQTTLGSLLAGYPVVKQIWEERLNPQALLAPGSLLSKNYYALKGYEVGSAKLVLTEPHLIDPVFLNEPTRVLMEGGVTKIRPPEGFLRIARTSAPSANQVIEIKRLYRESEFNSLAFSGVRGETIELKTSRALLPMPTLKFRLKVDLKDASGRLVTVFNGNVDARSIEVRDASYLIDLNTLPLSQRLGAGSAVRLEMTHSLQELSLLSRERAETKEVTL